MPDEDQTDTPETPARRTRAKFVVQKCDKNEWGGGRLVATPVMGDSEENKKFFAATPNGLIDLYVNNDVLDGFPVGKQFYVDLIPAD